jgi:hypothetical protein
MSLSGPALSSAILSAMASRGNTGSDLKKLTDSIGLGIILSLTGKSFSTVDAGPGPPVPTPTVTTGLIVPPGVMAPLITTAAIANIGGGGPELPLIALDIETSFIQELSKATLTSNHPATTAGAASITPGTIPVTASEVKGNIVTIGLATGLVGVDFPQIADAIGQGVEAAIKLASAVIVIAQPPSGPQVGPPVGVGTGVIT